MVYTGFESYGLQNAGETGEFLGITLVFKFLELSVILGRCQATKGVEGEVILQVRLLGTILIIIRLLLIIIFQQIF